jgi:hypothetical protein
MSGKIKGKDLKLTGKVGIQLCNCNLPFGGLLLQAIQFSVGVGGISLGGDKQGLGLLQKALPLFLFIQKLGNPALQLLYLGLVSSIPVVQLLGYIHRGHTVLVACLQCSLFICKDFKLKEFEERKQ